MKKSISIKIILLVLMLLSISEALAQKTAQGPATGRAAQPPADPKQLKYPRLRDWKVPEPVRVELSNGMVVYMLEDHELPVINMSALVRTGGRWDPADKGGLASIAASVMRTGGTTSKTGDQLDDELERIAAAVETSADNTSGSTSMSVLKEDLDTGLRILADVLMNPAFREDKIELEKIQHRDAIARRNDDIQEITDREFQKLVYGPTSPYARNEEYRTIDNITREDLIAFHKRYYHPNNVIAGVWGDFTIDEMRAKLESYFGKWQRTRLDVPPLPQVNYQPGGRVFFISKENVNQSNVAVGHLGGKQSDPDYFLLLTLNRVLGERFFVNIRDKQGLAYSVFANWNAGFDAPGYFFMGGQTKSESTVKFIKTLLAEIDKLSKEQVSDEELMRAKDSILNSFIFNFDTTGKVIGRLLRYEYFGYPKDFLLQYKQRVEKVTQADLLRVAKEHLRPEKFAFLVAGRDKDFDAPLGSLGLGEVAKVDIAIPEPKAAPVAAATAESAAKGKALLQAARKATGGEALDAVKDIVLKADAKLITPQGEFAIKNETTIKYPNKILNKLALPFGEVLQVYDGQVAWAKTPQGTRELSSDDAVEFQNAIAADIVFLLTHLDAPGYQAQFLEQADVDGRRANVVLVKTPNEHAIKVYLDADTGMVLRESRLSKAGGAPADAEENYSDYREVSGVRLPFKRTAKRNGQPFAEVTITEIKVNTGVTDQVFVKQ
ncbi:MAG TPA: pitrilysin family protein [Acidobacteriota bacterium]|jgi:zinc protease